jgi:transposase
MAYKYGERHQVDLMPACLEDYVSKDDPVRVYDAFVEGLDFKELGLVLDSDQVGAPEYNPRAMLKLLLYGYSYGIRSSRKLERATYHNLSFIWLMGGLKPDHKTISRFRRDHWEALKKVLRQCARLCMSLGLIEGNTLFVDGTRIKANASDARSWDKKKCEKYLNHLEGRIEEVLEECEQADEAEVGDGSWVCRQEALGSSSALKKRVAKAMRELENSDQKSYNATDPESRLLKSGDGYIVGYNVQSVVDDRHGLIVHAEAVDESNDVHQFRVQIEQANSVLGRSCKVACADSGYSYTEGLKAVEEQGIRVIVPSQIQSLHEPTGPFHWDKFNYDRERDCYICPEGQLLTYRKTDYKAGQKAYQVKDASVCRRCWHYGECTKAKAGRTIAKLIDDESKKRFEAIYRQPESQAIYRRRKQRAELPFGHIKWNLGVRSFLMRGIKGVQAEIGLLATSFNLVRMINLVGVSGLIRKWALAQ